ncbi:unnamed protein product [Urochloa humidicola]
MESAPVQDDVEMVDVDTEDNNDVPAVANFFNAPQPPLLPTVDCSTTAPPPSTTSPPPARRRRHRTFNMTAVRRSARLANAPRIPAIQKAQRNLCRKLGLLNNELLPIEAALQDFVAMFNGPLPQEIIAALAEMFNIDHDEEAEELDQAMLGLVDEGVAELHEAVQEMQLQNQVAQHGEA